MTQFTTPGFSLGDRVFTLDGREGVITASRFNDDGGFWEHLLDPIFEFFPEFELSRDDTEPPAPAPEPEPVIQIPPPEEAVEDVSFVTREELRDLVVAIVATLPRGEVTQADLDAAVNAGAERSNLIAQGNLQAHIAETSATAVALSEEQAAQFLQLESSVTTTLSEISNRATELETRAEESSGFGFLGFVGGIGGLLKDPVDWIMSRLGDHISSEVNDGLNR